MIVRCIVISMAAFCSIVLGACGDGGVVCATEGTTPNYLESLGCETDFRQLASEPIVSTIPGARSLKTVIDQADGDALYFQDSKRLQASLELRERTSLRQRASSSPVPLEQFNAVEYYSPDRRFILGACHAVRKVQGCGCSRYRLTTPRALT